MRSKDADTNKIDKKKAAVLLLQEDILSSVLHCFKDQHKCKADYCKTIRAIQPSIPLPTKNAVTSFYLIRHSFIYCLDVSLSPDASAPHKIFSNSFLSDTFPGISGNCFSDSTADTSSSSLSSFILDSPNDSILQKRFGFFYTFDFYSR